MTAACMLLLSLLLQITAAAAQQSQLQQGIAEKVLRFHVLANSDSEEDQRVKLLVRDGVLAYLLEQTEAEEAASVTGTTEVLSAAGRVERKEFTERTAEVEEKEKLRAYIRTHLPELTDVANQVLISENADYRAEAVLEPCYFPERTYGACTFPAGWYEALRIRLGEAKGHNWWCVLFPRLCFADCMNAVVEEEQLQQLEEVLTVEEYDCLLQDPGQWRFTFRWF